MKVMLVEDSRVLRERIRGMVEAIPQAKLVAETGSEGDALCLLEKMHPDIVVIDLKIDSGSGLSVLEHVRAVHPEITTIVLTNYGQPEYRNKCMALGAEYFFDKSLDIDEFNDLLVELQQIELIRLEAELASAHLNH